MTVIRPDLIRLASGKQRSAHRWAELAHRGQFRKGAPYGYITHVEAVSELMAAAGGDRNEVVAAILHDVVEDSDVHDVLPEGTKDADGHFIPRRIFIEDIEGEFGKNVARMVAAVTKGDEMKGIKLEDQAPVIMAKLLAAGISAVAVKACDLTINMGDLVWDAENHGVAHYSEVFGAHRAERKIRHYLKLADLIIEELSKHEKWQPLAEAVAFRRDELVILVEEYAAL